MQRCTTIGCLYAAALLNGLARRSLGVAVPALLDGGVMSKEETEEITALGYRFYAVGKLLAAPLVLRLGNKGTLVLQLAMISSCCAAFVAPFASRRVQVACWCMLRIFTAMAFASLVAFVRNWFPRNAYGRVWGFLNSGFSGLLWRRSAAARSWRAARSAGGRRSRSSPRWAPPLAYVGLLQNKPQPLAPPPPPAAPAPGAERAERAEQKAKAADDDARVHSRRAARNGRRGRRRAGWPRAARRRAGRAQRSGARALGARGRRGARRRRRRAGRPPEVGLELALAGTHETVPVGGGDKAVPSAAPAAAEERPSFAVLLRRFASRWQFWAMIVACACYSPIVEFGTYLSSYLKEIEGAKAFPACIASAGCERRYRIYVASYVTSLLAGSFIYDRCSQLDKALLVVLCYCINIGCWGTLALAEAPRSAALGLEAATPRWYPRAEWAAPLLQAVRDGLPLPRLAKSLVVAGGYGSIAIPSSLPFAMFAMDFGKEGAAMLSSILSAVGFGASLLFLHLFPPLLKRHGWRGVYGTLAALGLTAALAMSSIMFSDYSKFSRGYIITSSLLNETVVTLHACEKCTFAPMWRPGARRTYSYAAAKRNYSPLRPHAPTRRCHLCGRRTVVECKVGEAFAELSLMTPYAQCDAWVRERTPLRKGDGGWAFADPTRYPLAPKKTYGDERAYQLRIAMERRAAEGLAEEATDEAVEAAMGDTI